MYNSVLLFLFIHLYIYLFIIYWSFIYRFFVGVCVCVCVWGGGGGGVLSEQRDSCGSPGAPLYPCDQVTVTNVKIGYL